MTNHVGAFDKIVTELGYYNVSVEASDGLTVELSDCAPGYPGCSGGYDDDQSYESTEGSGPTPNIYMLAPASTKAAPGPKKDSAHAKAKLLAPSNGRPGGNASLDAIVADINAYAGPKLAAALHAQRLATPSAKNLQIVKLLGPDGFYLAFGRRSKGGARVAWRGWLRRWVRHWVLPWKQD